MRGLHCLAPALDFREAHIITYYYTFIRPRDGGATAQCAWEVASTKLVEGVGNFLGKVDQLAELAEAHLIGAHQLLPSQRLPTDIVCVIPRRRFARAQTLPVQRMPRQRPAALIWVLGGESSGTICRMVICYYPLLPIQGYNMLIIIFPIMDIVIMM